MLSGCLLAFVFVYGPPFCSVSRWVLVVVLYYITRWNMMRLSVLVVFYRFHLRD